MNMKNKKLHWNASVFSDYKKFTGTPKILVKDQNAVDNTNSNSWRREWDSIMLITVFLVKEYVYCDRISNYLSFVVYFNQSLIAIQKDIIDQSAGNI